MSKPSPVSGFPEFLPAQQIAMDKIREIIKETYESFGFTPLDTPVVERVSTLMAKGGAEHEIYGIHRLAAEERGGNPNKDLALRFDLTVPFARYVAQNYGQLTFPFRRYHIAPVWRGERPQAGRYRQFYQADIDVIGDSELGLHYDAEMPAIVATALKKMDIGNFTININNRKVLQGFFEAKGCKTTEDIQAAIRVIDDLEKIERSEILKQLSELGISTADAEATLELFTKQQSTDAWLSELSSMNLNDTFNEGVSELQTVVEGLRALGVSDDNFVVNPAIARGLGYYTGTIYETKLDDYPELGTVSAGGRYNDLAGKFTNKKLPGVGMSIGLSRLVVPLLEKGVIKAETSTVAPVVVTSMDSELTNHYLELGSMLREAGVKTEVYLENRSFKAQMKYADKRGFKIAIIVGSDEKEAGEVVVKDLVEGSQYKLSKAEFVAKVKELLGAS